MSVRVAFVALGVVALAVAGCGSPPNIDRDEAAVSARTCASFLERAALRRSGGFRLDGQRLDLLDDAPAFYAYLEAERNAETFARVMASSKADQEVSAEQFRRLCQPERMPPFLPTNGG
ncbi:MAG: hypothetical protein ACRD0U_21035 [Acidimicrobiales bacterium]